MATIGAMSVEISASTKGFDRAMQETTRTMDRFSSRSGVNMTIGVDTSDAIKQIDSLKKKVESGASTQKINASQSAVAFPSRPPDFLESIGAKLEQVAVDFSSSFDRDMSIVIDKILKKLRTATIGDGKSSNVVLFLAKGVASYVTKIGEARIAWNSVRDAELRAGKTMEQAQNSADIWQAESVAQKAGGLTKLISGYEVLKEKIRDASKLAQQIGVNASMASAPSEPSAPTLPKIDSQFLGKVSSMVSDSFAKIGGVIGKVAGTVRDLFGGALRSLAPLIKVLIIGAGALTAVFGVGLVVVGGIYAGFVLLKGVFTAVQSALSAIAGVFSAIFDLVGDIVKAFGEAVVAVYKIGKAIFAQVYAPFDYVFGKIGSMFSSVYDTIMSGFQSIRGFILGALTTATLAWLGKIAFDSGAFGAGLGGLSKMMRGGKEKVERRDAGGNVLEDQGFLQDVVDRSSASIKRFFDKIQTLFGSWFGQTVDIVGMVSDKVVVAIDWITANIQTVVVEITKGIIYITKILDSFVGVVIALFQGDWSGAGAMALEVGAKVSDGLALIVKMIAPYLDWIVNKISELVGWIIEKLGAITGAVIQLMGEGFKIIEQPIRSFIADVISIASTIADFVSGAFVKIIAMVAGLVVYINEAIFRIFNPIEFATDAVVGASAEMQQAREKSVLGGLDPKTLLQGFADGTKKVTDSMRGKADKIKNTSNGDWSKVITDLGKKVANSSGKLGTDLQGKGKSGLGTSDFIVDGLEKLSKSARDKANELNPTAKDQLGGTLDPVVKMLEDFQKMIGGGTPVDPLGKIVDQADSAKNASVGDASTLSVDTALGQVKLAGSVDKGAQIAKNALTEAQKQTMILQKVEDLLGDSGKDGKNFVQVKDSSGNMVSVSKELTKMVTRIDPNDATKSTTSPELLVGEELKKRMEDLKIIAENMLGGKKDMSDVDIQGILKSDPSFLKRAVDDSSKISQESKDAFSKAGDPETHKLIIETNGYLKKMANSKTGSPFT